MYADRACDLVLAVGLVEHLPARNRRAQVDEYYYLNLLFGKRPRGAP